jgi:outer membrane immunogenic protein
MKIPVLVGSGFAALVASSVMAADMGVKAPVMKAPPAVFSWTGCYLGGHFGSLFSEENWTGAAQSIQDPTDLVVGGQVGCNYQVSTWVFGVQGDYAWTNASDTALDQLSGLTDRSKITSLASVTGRIGYALDRWLPYVKAGGAWTHDKYDIYNPAFGLGSLSATSETRGGWTVGGGIEYAIVSNLSIFAEYDWYDFGTRTTSLPAFGPVDIKERDSVLKMGLNWTFR